MAKSKMTIIAIDPGTTESAFVVYRDGILIDKAIMPNEEMRNELASWRGAGHTLAIEMIASYGMAVGREVFETCVWIGRFVEAYGGEHVFVYRKNVKLELCGTARAKDANVRQALLDRFGGSKIAVGIKSSPGPLYGVKSHMWSALAVAVTCAGKK